MRGAHGKNWFAHVWWRFSAFSGRCSCEFTILSAMGRNFFNQYVASSLLNSPMMSGPRLATTSYWHGGRCRKKEPIHQIPPIQQHRVATIFADWLLISTFNQCWWRGLKLLTLMGLAASKLPSLCMVSWSCAGRQEPWNWHVCLVCWQNEHSNAQCSFSFGHFVFRNLRGEDARISKQACLVRWTKAIPWLRC